MSPGDTKRAADIENGGWSETYGTWGERFKNWILDPVLQNMQLNTSLYAPDVLNSPAFVRFISVSKSTASLK